MPLDRHTGRVALITGANSGIGKELARQLAMAGRHRSVLLGCRDPARGERARAELVAATGRQVFGVVGLDLSRVAAVRHALSQMPEAIDDLVMNAGGLGGTDPFRITDDGVVEIVAANVLGHAALLEGLIGEGLMRRSAVLAGSEAARGVSQMGIKRPEVRSGSADEFIEVCDGTRFGRDGADRFSAYAWTKLLGALWMGAMARRHPDLRLLTMSPGGTSGTAGMDVLPQPARFLVGKVVGPYILPLLGLGHGLKTGTRRLAEAIEDERYRPGVFYASRSKTTGTIVDQAGLFAVLGDQAVQDNAAAAVNRFLRSGGSAEAGIRADAVDRPARSAP